MTDSELLKPEDRPKPKRAHRSIHGLGKFVTDLELIEYLGLPEREGRDLIRSLDGNRMTGFPPKQPLMGNRRFLPAVDAWLEHNYGLRPQEKRRSA